MQKVTNFFSEVRIELEKVTWPKREVVINYLGLVLAISIVVAVFVGGVDFTFTKGLEYFLAR